MQLRGVHLDEHIAAINGEGRREHNEVRLHVNDGIHVAEGHLVEGGAEAVRLEESPAGGGTHKHAHTHACARAHTLGGWRNQ